MKTKLVLLNMVSVLLLAIYSDFMILEARRAVGGSGGIRGARGVGARGGMQRRGGLSGASRPMARPMSRPAAPGGASFGGPRGITRPGFQRGRDLAGSRRFAGAPMTGRRDFTARRPGRLDGRSSRLDLRSNRRLDKPRRPDGRPARPSLRPDGKPRPDLRSNRRSDRPGRSDGRPDRADRRRGDRGRFGFRDRALRDRRLNLSRSIASDRFRSADRINIQNNFLSRNFRGHPWSWWWANNRGLFYKFFPGSFYNNYGYYPPIYYDYYDLYGSYPTEVYQTEYIEPYYPEYADQGYPEDLGLSPQYSNGSPLAAAIIPLSSVTHKRFLCDRECVKNCLNETSLSLEECCDEQCAR